MDDATLTPAGHAEAARRIAVLRGLYGDLGDALNDRAGRQMLLAQIEQEHTELVGLLEGVDTGGSSGPAP